jgi:hypothetical protein
MFLKALRKVALSQNRPMTEIAEACGVSREALYRMLCETGNPTSENRRAILAALGLKAIVVPIEEPRIVATARSDASRNAISAHVKLKDNSLSGGSGTLKSTMVSGEITLAEQLRKEPARAWRNFNANAVGCGPDIAQIGGHN